jgi:hypothetical protein
MYKSIEYLYLTFRIFISKFFETMTCRTKPDDYQACNFEEESIHLKPVN